jgi:hypothetical protein
MSDTAREIVRAWWFGKDEKLDDDGKCGSDRAWDRELSWNRDFHERVAPHPHVENLGISSPDSETTVAMPEE